MFSQSNVVRCFSLLLSVVTQARRRVSRGSAKGNVWARPGMRVAFRAELMPGRVRAERSFRVANVLPMGRVHLEGITGEHTETEFEKYAAAKASK